MNELEKGLNNRMALSGSRSVTTASPSQRRQASLANLMRKEAALTIALRSERGLQKVAAALANPVKKHLDYVPVFRKFGVVEPIPDGMKIYFDNDVPEFTALQVGKDGTTKIEEIEVGRVDVEEIQFVTRPKVPYRELFIRKYKVLNRTKERLQQGLGLREDLYGFNLLHANCIVRNTEMAVPTQLTKHALAKGMTEVEKRRNIVKSILLSPFGIQGIRRWQWQDLDETAREEIRKTGYIGSMWGADFFVSDQVLYNTADDTTYAYCIAEPDKFAWIPIRKDADVVAADNPDNLLLGFVGYEMLGMIVHNSYASSRVKFYALGDL